MQYIEGLKKLLELKEQGEIFRLGKLFDTEKNHYFYDTGTGKVIQLDEESYNILSYLYDEKDCTSYKDYIEKINDSTKEALKDLMKSIESEHLFKAPEVKKLYDERYLKHVEKETENNLYQVILELTGRCNLRCGYCIYNDSYKKERNFNSKDMTIETAKKAIDYANKHCGDEIAVTFYGGEPLLKFDLLRETIEYAQKVIKDKKLSFSFTTNLTLLTEKMAEYFSTVENLSILCSLDGPEKIQNSYRKYVNGQGTFNEAIRGLKYLTEAFKGKDNGSISINGVFTPPYTFEKVEEIDNFFKGLDWLPKDTSIRIDYPTEGSVDEESFYRKIADDERYMKNGKVINVLRKWKRDKIKDESNGNIEKDIYSNSIIKSLILIHNRTLSESPLNYYQLNGCCVPGARRLYINTQGELSICERMGESPKIGNIYEGLDIEKIKRIYVKDYSDESVEDCSKCWAVRLCNQCYCNNYNKNGINIEAKREQCISEKNYVESSLRLYHSIYETEPQKLDELNTMKIK